MIPILSESPRALFTSVPPPSLLTSHYDDIYKKYSPSQASHYEPRLYRVVGYLHTKSASHHISLPDRDSLVKPSFMSSLSPWCNVLNVGMPWLLLNLYAKESSSPCETIVASAGKFRIWKWTIRFFHLCGRLCKWTILKANMRGAYGICSQDRIENCGYRTPSASET